MAYPEKHKRKPGLTGRWVADFTFKGTRHVDAFGTKAEADGFEAYVRATGQVPPAHKVATRTGSTFREVAELSKHAGGALNGKSNGVKDTRVLQS